MKIVKNVLLLVMWTWISMNLATIAILGIEVNFVDTKSYALLRRYVGYDDNVQVYTYKDKES